MRTALSTVFRLLPLAAASFLMAADGDACIVLQNDTNTCRDPATCSEGEGEGDACPDLSQLCPSLVCDSGFVTDENGCSICECAPVACTPDGAAPLPPECANPVFDPSTCSWSCESQRCASSAECAPGTACIDGLCQRTDVGCFSDVDCGPGFFCSFGSSSDPLPPDGEGDRAAPPPPGGVCQPLPNCFSDADCAEGERCVPVNSAGGLVAVQSVCVAVTPSCAVDDDCALGQRCLLSCTGSCPECDDCTVIVGTCAEVAVPCDTDDQCRRGEVCLSGDPAARPCLDSDGDGLCDGAADPIPPPPQQGVCGAPPVITGCFSDGECGPGAVCRLPDGCACNVCIPDDTGACADCDCPGLVGTCEPVGPADGECFDDSACAAGEKCVIYAVGCEQPACEIGPDGEQVCHPCDPLAVGRCETVPASCTSDLDCGPGAYCELPSVFPPPCDPNQGCDIPVPLPEGVCVPYDVDPCLAVLCAPGTACVVDDAGNAACVEDPCLYVRCTSTSHCEAQRDGSAQCVPNPAECRADEDCGGGTCNAADVCLPNPECAPGDVCTRECWGYCSQPTAECTSDADCGGGTCNAAEVCLSNPRCAEGDLCTNECWGFCIQPLVAECRSDADCGGGTCNAADLCLPNPNCSPDGPCTDDCWGVCLPPG